MRRTLTIAGIALLVLAVVGYGTWALTRSAPDATTEAPTQSFFARLFPFGTPQSPSGGSLGTPQATTTRPAGPVPRLRKISDKPVAGGTIFGSGTSTIRYVERETGNVYETRTDTLTLVRLSHTTIPGTESVLWASKAELILRSLDDTGTIENFHTTISTSTPDQSLTGIFMPNFNRAVIDPTGKTLISVTEGANGSTVTSSRPDGSGARTIFNSPLRSLVPLATPTEALVATAPAAGVPGFLFRISGGTLSTILGNIVGLMALPSPSGRYIAYSSGAHNTLTLAMLDTKTGTSYVAPLGTIVSKCVWISEAPPTLVCGVPATLPTGDYPTDWLLGAVSLTDDVWLINPVESTVTRLVRPEDETGDRIDVMEPRSSDGSYITFINKKDLSFWSLRVKN